MITRAKFLDMVRLYRLAAQVDITRYAANYAYLELLQGRKTALVKRIEKMYRRQMDEYDMGAYLKAKRVATPKQLANRGGKHGVNYLNPKLLEQVLDPDLNLKTKTATFKRAFMEGKLFMILECSKHGIVMHRTSVTTCRGVSSREKNNYQGYCLVCKTVDQVEYERKIEAIHQFRMNYLEYREHHNQSAS